VILLVCYYNSHARIEISHESQWTFFQKLMDFIGIKNEYSLLWHQFQIGPYLYLFKSSNNIVQMSSVTLPPFEITRHVLFRKNKPLINNYFINI
jgi:hypothetical protein